MLRDRPYLLLVATNYCYAMSAMALNIAVPVYIIEFLGLPGWVAGAVFTINTVMIGLGQGWWSTRCTALFAPTSWCWASLSTASYAVLLSADWVNVGVGVAVVLVGIAIYTGGEMVFSPVITALSTDAAPDHLRGRYVSLYQMSWTAFP